MLDRTILLPVMLFAGVCCCGVSAGVPADGSGRDGVYGTLLIDGSVSPEVTPVEYGFHYEEIGMLGEGALHAELVRNRSFEEATPPADLSVRNGLYQDVPAPRGKNKKVYRAAFRNPGSMGANARYRELKQRILGPILERFEIPAARRPYYIAYYIEGIAAIVKEWLRQDCADEVEMIADIIESSVRTRDGSHEK